MSIQLHRKAFTVGSNEGFSLVEIMITVAIFSIIALALGTQVIQSTHNNIRSSSVTGAAVIGAGEIEQMFAVPYNDTRLTDGPHTVSLSNGLTLEYTVSTGAILPRTKSVQVIASFSEKGGAQRSVSYNYLVPQYIR